MDNRKRNNSGNNQTAIMKICGFVLLLAAVFVVTLVLLLKIKSNNSTSRTTAMAESQETAGSESVTEVTPVPTVEVTPEPTAEPTPTPEPEPAFVETLPENEEGTGGAGLIPMDDGIRSLPYENGWYINGINEYYSPDGNLIYYNGWAEIAGLLFHFDGSGMVDKGWKLIGGQSCYFDDQGIYKPDQDPNKLLAFTFDDGPSQGSSDLLDLCEQTGARISFFFLGELTPEYGGCVPRLIQDRCQLGSHSTEHLQMTKRTTEECVSDFLFSDAMIRDNGGGYDTSVYRFPYGDFTAEQTASIGKPSIMWSLDSLDWDLKNTQAVIDRVLSLVSEGDIILMHDIYNTTIEACQYLFPYLQEQGYQLVTVEELAAAKGYKLEAGHTYYSFSNDGIAAGTAIQ